MPGFTLIVATTPSISSPPLEVCSPARDDTLPREACVMAQGVKIDTVRSSSSGTPGRSLNSARQQHFILDSPSGPNEAGANGEAFLAGVSACGGTLIETYALDQKVP